MKQAKRSDAPMGNTTEEMASRNRTGATISQLVMDLSMIAIVLVLIIAVAADMSARNAQRIAETKTASASKTVVDYIDCMKSRPKISTKSANDEKVYLIDICAVADSADGDVFRVERK